MRKITATFIAIFIILFNAFSFAEAQFPSISSPSAILIESKTGQMIYGKDINKKLYPASITKVMTALLTLENCKLDEKVTASRRAVFSIERGSSTASLQEGEEITVEQLVYALMLNSANEAANILAESVGKSIEGFVDLMNKRAKELGTKNTHFVTPNGLHSDKHYSTVYDMALIARQAMKNPEFRKIVSTVKYHMPPTNKYKKDDKFFYNSNKLINPAAKYYYKYAIGVKTGYTTKAGHTLISGASKDGIDLIMVSMNSKVTNGSSEAYIDAIKLFNYTFNNYKLIKPVKKGSLVKQIPILNAKGKVQLQITSDKDLSILCPKNAENFYTTNQVLNENITAPLKRDTIVGSIELVSGGKVIDKANLIAMNNIDAASNFGFIKVLFKIILYIILIILIAFIVLVLAMLIWVKTKKRKIKLVKNNDRSMKIDRFIK